MNKQTSFDFQGNAAIVAPNEPLQGWQMTPVEYILSRPKLAPFGGNLSAYDFNTAVSFCANWSDGREIIKRAKMSLLMCHSCEVLRAMQGCQFMPERVLQCYKPESELLSALQRADRLGTLRDEARKAFLGLGETS